MFNEEMTSKMQPFGFRRIWRIKQISEGVIHLDLLSSSYPTQPHSLVTSYYYSACVFILVPARALDPCVVMKQYRVFQKFFPIINCIFRKAFNASLGKCKLVQVRNLSK